MERYESTAWNIKIDTSGFWGGSAAFVDEFKYSRC